MNHVPKPKHVLRTGAIAVALALAGTAPALGEEFTETYSIPGDNLLVLNLIGEIRIEGHSGSDYQVDVHVRGADASREIIQIQTREGGDAELVVEFPIERRARFVYPELGRNSRTNFSIGSRWGGHQNWLEKFLDSLGADEIEVRGSGSGLEVWADVTVHVPRDKAAHVDLGVGKILARNVEGDLTLQTRSGSVKAMSITGELQVDTGSGHVDVESVHGRLGVDTGSGHVRVETVEGDLVEVDTGSGHVEIGQITCEELSVDTGSGHVKAERVSTNDVTIDTGSGSVTLELIEMGDGVFMVDTGSGSIDLLIPVDASADVTAETSSGGIRVDVLDPDIRHRERNEIAFRIGNGDAEVRLDTGSGGIRIEQP